MTVRDFYIDLQYTELLDVNSSTSENELEEFRHLGVDKVYFSSGYPAIFFKEVNQFDKEALKEIARVQHFAWNYRKVMFLFAISPSEIRIYNCCQKPFNYDRPDADVQTQTARLELMRASENDKEALQTISELFSRIAVDSGLFWTSENELRKQVDIQQRIDKYLVKSLLSAAKELKNSGLNDENIIHSLLMRSIFIMYLEDKGAAKETKLYSQISVDAQSYIDILRDDSATYALFNKVQEHFNGNVFPVLKGEKKQVTRQHLEIIRKCLTDGDLSNNPKLFEWRLFRFDVIQIELLSEIYENFLEEFKELSKQEAGQYYTPPSLVELILNEKLKTKNETNYNVKILDPACGSGIFLVESFKRLVKRWKNANPDKRIEFKDLREIVRNSIYGIELDRYAIRVAAFSIYLAIVEQLNPKTLWIDKRYKFPYLISDITDKSLEQQGSNLFRADTIGEVDSAEFPKFDLVVGNPPFGAKIKLLSVRKFLNHYGYGKDLVIPFLRKAVDFTDSGSIALIFNTKVLTNTEIPFQKFRKWLLTETYVEKIYNLSIFRKAPKTFGGQLFTSAVGPVSIVFYQKQSPRKPSDTIEYWAPKTYIKNSLVEGVIIDATDIKHLPRVECQKPNTKIWKIAMWGSLEDFKLIERLRSKHSPLKTFLKEFKIKSGVGFQLLTDKKDKILKDDKLSSLKYIDADLIEPYYTRKENLGKLNKSIRTKKAISFYLNYYGKKTLEDLPAINAFRRLGEKDAYTAPHFVIKKGLKDGLTCASYLDYNCAFRDGVYGFYNSPQNEGILKLITAFLNSAISNYYLFLSISSYGIERDQIMKSEYLEIPFSPLPQREQDSILDSINNLINLKKEDKFYHQNKLHESIEKIFFESLNISKYDSYLIEDAINYNIDLFQKGIASRALKPVELNETRTYTEILCEIVNAYSSTGLKLNGKIYDIGKKDPLNMVVLEFGDTSREIQQGDEPEIRIHLKNLDKMTLSKKAQSIYLKKQIKYYDDKFIYIIKPNQKRFWCRSVAINDSKELISEILKMEYSE